MAKEKITLYIDDTSLRLLVTQDQQIKEWANLPLEPGLVKNNVVIKETEVSAKIQQLFKDQKIKTKRIIVGISGLRCLSRPIIFPQLPKEVLDEAVKREAKRLLPVPIEQLYLSWQSVPAPAGKTQVFLVAVPRNTADALFKTLRQAGLHPYLLDLKPLILMKVLKEATGVIVDVQNSEFDIVVMSEGMPQPVRTISFANERLSWAEKLTIIKNDAERTVAFFNSNNPEKTLAASAPIFASGELANEPQLCQNLSQEIGHPVIPLSSPLEHSDKFVPGLYMANIGLALHKVASGKEFGPSTININSLPATYQPKGVSLTNILPIPVAAVAAVLLIFIFMLNQNTSADIASIRSKLATTEQLLQQRTSQRAELSKNIGQLEKQITDVEKSVGEFTAAVGSLEKQTTGLNRDLQITMTALPQTITLKSITHGGNLLTIAGHSPDERGILTYVGKLDASGIFADITVTSISRNEDDTMDFTLLGNHEGQKIAIGSLEIVVNNLPPGVNLLQVSYGKNAMTVNATAPAQDRILSYLRRLEESGQFSDVVVTEMTRRDSGELEFTLLLKIGE